MLQNHPVTFSRHQRSFIVWRMSDVVVRVECTARTTKDCFVQNNPLFEKLSKKLIGRFELRMLPIGINSALLLRILLQSEKNLPAAVLRLHLLLGYSQAENEVHNKHQEAARNENGHHPLQIPPAQFRRLIHAGIAPNPANERNPNPAFVISTPLSRLNAPLWSV